MKARATLISAALLGCSSVALGAWGSHGAQTVLSIKMIEIWQIAVQYQQLHALALLALGIALMKPVHTAIQIWFGRSAILMVLGTLLFSGSIYFHALSGVHLSAITPLGGLTWMVAWLLILVATLKLPVENVPTDKA